MNITNYQLRKLVEQDNILNNIYYQDRLQKLGLQENLNEVYKPLIDASKSIETKIEETSKNAPRPVFATDTTKMEEKLDEIVGLLDNFPNVIAHLKGDVAQPLTPEEAEVIQTVEKLPENDLKVLAKKLNVRSLVNVDVLLNIFKAGDLESIEQIKNDQQLLSELIDNAVIEAPDIIDKRSKYFIVDSYIPGFINEVYARKNERKKEGTGLKRSGSRSTISKKSSSSSSSSSNIKFLPSATKDLVKEMNKLLASYKAGNKNTFNEISSIVDILRERGLINPEMNKKIFKYMKLN